MCERRNGFAAPARFGACCAFLLSLLAIGGVGVAQSVRDSATQIHPDTSVRLYPNASLHTHADSLLLQVDTVKKIAAAPLPVFYPIRRFGSIDSSTSITQRDRIYSLTNESYDALRQQSGFYPLDFASAGQNNDLLINGLDMRNTAVLLDGRSMNDPLTGRFSFMHISPDFSGTNGNYHRCPCSDIRIQRDNGGHQLCPGNIQHEPAICAHPV